MLQEVFLLAAAILSLAVAQFGGRPQGGGGFRCPQEQGQFEAQGDCTRYWQCDAGAATLQECPLQLIFNPQVGYCDWPLNTPNPGCGAQRENASSVTDDILDVPKENDEEKEEEKKEEVEEKGEEEKKEEEEKERLLRDAANIIRNEIQSKAPNDDAFPSGEDMDSVESLANLSPSLKYLLDTVYFTTQRNLKILHHYLDLEPASQICQQNPYGGNRGQAFHVAHPTACNAFYTCDSGYVYPLCTFCGEGMYFSKQSGLCTDYLATGQDVNALCGGRTFIEHRDKVFFQMEQCWPFASQPNPFLPIINGIRNGGQRPRLNSLNSGQGFNQDFQNQGFQNQGFNPVPQQWSSSQFFNPQKG